MRPDIEHYFMDMARLVASRTTCLRRSVGCVLIDEDNHVLATGYNGVTAGAPHCNDVEVTSGVVVFPHACPGSNAPSGQNIDSCYAVHAEQNAMLQCRDARDIATAFVTTFPCPSCTKLLLNSSCTTIVYDAEYADDAGKKLWLAAGRLAIQFNGEPHMIQKDIVTLFGAHEEFIEWRVVVACVCLNIASARVARGIVMRLFEKWPTPYAMCQADEALEAMLKPLGLSAKRAAYLREIGKRWEHAASLPGSGNLSHLPGVGRYAMESVRIFCRGERLEVIGDRKVAAWQAWRDKNISKKV